MHNKLILYIKYATGKIFYLIINIKQICFFRKGRVWEGKTHPAYVEQSETKRHGSVQKNGVSPLKKVIRTLLDVPHQS